MKQDTKLIRVDLDFKNAFNSAGHSSLWKILEGFGVPDVSLLSSIYEHSTMRIQVGRKSSAAIQLDTGTVQGAALSPLQFDLFINALLRLLDSTGISHRVRGVPKLESSSLCRRTLPLRRLNGRCQYSAGYCERIPGVEQPEDIHLEIPGYRRPLRQR